MASKGTIIFLKGTIIWIIKLPSKISIASEVMNGAWRRKKEEMNSC